jgi:glyoxylase-like metal-dependent hydrolase (beta-lactamase superfamily II)
VKSDGSIWFSDPDFGITSDYEGYRAESEIGSNNVYRIDPTTGDVRLVADCFGAPNGLVFSPDEQQLFVSDTRAGKIWVFDVREDGTLSGGEVFAEAGAIVVAHENARRTIIGEQRPTAVPQLTFEHRMNIELGGKTVELIYPGRSHSDNLIAMRFPEERAVFAVDFISVKRLPYQNLSDAYFPDWIEAVKEVEGLDFDILLPGHGPVGTKADATDHRRYLEDLHDAVLAAARQGQSLEEMQASITLDKYQDWEQYEAWRPLNIEGMYNQVSLHRRGN